MSERRLNVLVACEFSGRVRDAFTALGHNALSCDLIDSETPGQHYIGDVRDLLCMPWDLLIAFPPCTYLCSSGARWWAGRQQEQQDALEFVRELMNFPGPYCIENPVGRISVVFRRPNQIIQPWMFGDCESKKTCLWTSRLPFLHPTNIVNERKSLVHHMSPSPDRQKNRSRTYLGIAQAMAKQFGDYLCQ